MNILLLGPTGRNQRIRQYLTGRGDQVHVTQEPINLDFLRMNKINFLISNGYAPIIKHPVTATYARRIINLHPTFLPYGKGIFPNFWSFFEGAPKGVSIHFIDEGIDTGDILFQKHVEYSEKDTLRSFYDKLLAETESLFFEHWEDIVTGRYKIIRQQGINAEVRYRNRIDSERMMELLPAKWDTLVTDVMALGADFALSEQFWRRYETEANSMAISQ
jgi:folate-dependent phosphoribosylglycinamide formyltransferase PurN